MPIEPRCENIARHFLCSQEVERSQLARDLHIELGQQLAALLMGLKIADQQHRPQSSPRDLSDLVERAEAIDQTIHRLTLELRPASLDDLGLIRALSACNENWTQHSSVELQFHASGFNRGRPPDPMEMGLYRFVQQALREAVRAGGAKRISVILKRTPGQATAIIEDDSVNEPNGWPGIAALEERAILCGGELNIECDGHSTTLFVRLPIPPDA